MRARQVNSTELPLKISALKIVKPRFWAEKSRSHFKGSLALGVDDRLAFPLTDPPDDERLWRGKLKRCRNSRHVVTSPACAAKAGISIAPSATVDLPEVWSSRLKTGCATGSLALKAKARNTSK